MPTLFEQVWEKKIKDPLWYMDVPKLLGEMYSLRDEDKDAYEGVKEEIYDFAEKNLKEGKIALGSTGKDFDRDRLPIDTVVIHHTSMKPGLSLDRLSAIDLFRLYATQYAKPTYEADRGITGHGVYSGHFRKNKKTGQSYQVFWPYHWIIRMDGKTERLLHDKEIGWHAGDWDVNRRSVAIVFDNDYEDAEPEEKILESAVDLIGRNYKNAKILGHCEINKKTTCPSRLFLGKNGWKEKLLLMLQ